jgi:hypothetical protein
MQPEPAAREIDARMDRLARRARLADVMSGASAGLVAGAVGTAVVRSQGRWIAVVTGVMAMVVVALAFALVHGRRRTHAAIAADVERLHPAFRNVLVTAVELRAHPDRARDWMRARVAADAAARLAVLDLPTLVSLRRPAWLMSLAAAAWVGVLLALPERGASVAQQLTRSAIARMGIGGPAPLVVTARLEPPAYTGQAPTESRNPERIEAIAGTMLRLTMSGGAGPSGVRLSGTAVPTTAVEGGARRVELVLAQSGYLAVDAAGTRGPGTTSMLIPIVVTPDRTPSVRIETPGRDLLVAAAASRLPIAVSASDDLALAQLELRYTKVSGSGEQFEFEEGTLPLDVRRVDERTWGGRGELPLDALALAPGDSLVYRAAARDRRPGAAGLATSDTFFVEIQGPGQVPLDGIEMPPEQERYALSQQMVLLKIQRLRAKEASLPRAAVQEEAAAIAAEQRAVRANFIFLMGGHVEDEFEEAEQSHEIQEGRLENNARRDISQAIHQMSLAEQGLVASDTGRALPPARAAVDALQRAFGRNRYILRTISPRSRIDPSRRLTGTLSAAAGWRREATRPDRDDAGRAVGDLLADLLALAADLDRQRPIDGTRVGTLAEQALAVDPASAVWQEVSRNLIEVRAAVVARRPGGEVLQALDAALKPVIDSARAGARGPIGEATAPAGALRSAWATEGRR